MEIGLRDVKSMEIGNNKQLVFTVTPGVLRQNLGEILNRVYYCKPPHKAYVTRGKVDGGDSGIFYGGLVWNPNSLPV